MMAQDAVQGGMSLARLLEGIAVPSRDVEIGDITLDSRAASAGGAFLACRGIRSHGLDHLATALARGVRAVVWEPGEGVATPVLPPQVVGVRVPQLGTSLGLIANRFFGSPSAALRIAGITGTNGKTTTAWLLAQALEANGRRAAYAGTLGVGPIDAVVPSMHTTPDCITLHRQLSDLHAAGVRTLGMEVSSHALAQDRVAGVHFDTALFTNLTRDHLDYHLTMEAYGDAKARLFSFPGLEHRVINMGDEFGRRLVDRLSSSVALTAFWAGPGEHGDAADRFVRGRSVHPTRAGLEIDVESSWGAARLRSRLIGEFNAENLLGVLAVLLLWEVPMARALAALESARPPAGRMETFNGGAHRPLAVVDYAHSPDALRKALRAARQHCRGRLWCVFGCGGDRDPGKRPMMGAIAAELADEVVLTDDNPRTEDPQRIVDAILAGIPPGQPRRVIRDRARAIATALSDAAPGDIVLIAGKGHEDYQIVGTTSLPFSDQLEVRRCFGDVR